MKRVLFITHITGFLRPGNGGQLRTHFVLKELSRNNHVDVYCDQFKTSIETTPEWTQLGLKNSVAPSLAIALRAISQRRGGTRLTGILNAIFTSQKSIGQTSLPKSLSNQLLNQFVLQSDDYDCIMLDTLQCYPEVSWKNPGRSTWLNAHNVDSILNPNDHRVLALETNLGSLIDGVVCCTISDEERFQNMNVDSIATVCWPNGTDEPNQSIATINAPNNSEVLFVGSLNYPPNVEGIRWYLNAMHLDIIEANDQYAITIAGRNPSEEFVKEMEQFPKVTVIPNAPDLSELYFKHCTSIVPLLSGSGSRLKIPESLIHGCPVLSTSIGAEGYLSQPIPGLTLADSQQDFQGALKRILEESKNGLNRESISQHASTHFTWTATVQPSAIGLD